MDTPSKDSAENKSHMLILMARDFQFAAHYFSKLSTMLAHASGGMLVAVTDDTVTESAVAEAYRKQHLLDKVLQERVESINALIPKFRDVTQTIGNGEQPPGGDQVTPPDTSQEDGVVGT